MRLGTRPLRRWSNPELSEAIVATVVHPEAADKELIERAEQGDRDAFAALYERHFQGLYDFALRIVRDADLAADIVQSTFVKAWDAARKQKGVENVKAWLYTITHNLAIDELRLRKRLAEPSPDGTEETGFPFALADPSKFSDPEAVVQDRELVELVWEAAAGLNPQEYALLDLHLRRGLDADELSRHLSLAKSAVYTRLSRLRDSLEEAVTSTLMMRRGRWECLDLDWLLEDLRATEITQPVRRAIKQHLKDCERCQESKRRLVSPAAIFAGISLVPVTLELQSAVWARVAGDLGLATTAAAAGGGGADAAATGDMGVNGAAAAATRDMGVNGAAAEVTAPVEAGVSSMVGAKGVALSALATGAAVVTATTLVFTGAGGKVEDPGDVHSSSHAVGRPSTNNVVKMAWSRVDDADAYSVSWTRGSELPDRAADLDGDATAAKSPALAPGRWYFNLRTRGDGDWTSTVHVGPFVIVAERKLSVRKATEPRRSPKRKRILQVEKHDEPSTALAPVRALRYRSSGATESGRMTDDPATATGVAGVVAPREQPKESADAANQPPAPTPRSEPKTASTSPPPPPPREPVTTSTSPPPPPPPVTADTSTSPPPPPPPVTAATSTSPPPPPPPEPLSAQPPPPPPGDDEDDDTDEADGNNGNKGNDGLIEGKEHHDEAQGGKDPQHEEDREKAEKPPKN
jgi:RNA polymerase sigma factor (sigma-70 family)